MFDKQAYQKACARLTLDAEKLEEMIAMTENTNPKKHLSRPIKTVLIAAACVAALCITAFAAPAVQKLFMTTTITYTDAEGNPETTQMFVSPDLSLDKRDGKDILTVDGKEIDVTEAFAENGKYVMYQDEATITITPDGEVTSEMFTPDGSVVYSFQLGDDLPGTFSINVNDETLELEGGEVGTYTIVDPVNDSAFAITKTPPPTAP